MPERETWICFQFISGKNESKQKNRELYEFYRAILYNPDKTLQCMSCQQMLIITYATSGLLRENYTHRIDVCREEVHERLRKFGGKQE